MADFAENFTARYVVRYVVLGLEHSTMFRIARASGPIGLANMVAKAGQFFAALESLMFTDWAILGAKYSAEDTNFFSPATIPTSPTPGVTIPAALKSQSILATSFVGSSTQGQKARQFIYGLSIGPENTAFGSSDDFRITAGDTSVILDAIAVLNNGAPQIVASDNNAVQWYSYVNTKYNDFHLKHIRA